MCGVINVIHERARDNVVDGDGSVGFVLIEYGNHLPVRRVRDARLSYSVAIWRWPLECADYTTRLEVPTNEKHPCTEVDNGAGAR